ncbi:hypothetical protein H6F77_02120 [Microcoleus sp. FACHB-831]|uniref:hypothetical protein n=1 Tax=Microcoleus sp. FACHB-831 TaxID=2692827 RepID=UPI0016837AA6|nr:hypothetical protein [Microcoleus sp. FACHB-831]MBD1919915.1 hypothetical protein [Microcoleus sp. FACHB-831]
MPPSYPIFAAVGKKTKLIYAFWMTFFCRWARLNWAIACVNIHWQQLVRHNRELLPVVV